MKNRKIILLFGALIALAFTACSTVKYVPYKETEYVHVHDTTFFHDTTIIYQIEKERYTDNTGLLDTLKLSTEYANATAYIDTAANLLKGTIENKPDKEIPIRWKEKIVRKDSIIYKEKPVPYEVEKTVYKQNFIQKLLTWIGIFVTAWFLVKLLFKFLAGKQIKIFGKIISF